VGGGILRPRWTTRLESQTLLSTLALTRALLRTALIRKTAAEVEEEEEEEAATLPRSSLQVVVVVVVVEAAQTALALLHLHIRVVEAAAAAVVVPLAQRSYPEDWDCLGKGLPRCRHPCQQTGLNCLRCRRPRRPHPTASLPFEAGP